MNKDAIITKIKERQEGEVKKNQELRYMLINHLKSNSSIRLTTYFNSIQFNEGFLEGLRSALAIIDSEDTSE